MDFEGMSLHARVVRLAAAQFHVVSNRQLRAMGVSRSWVQVNTRTGLMSPIVPGVHLVGIDPSGLSNDTCSMIGILRCARPAALHLESAAERHGIWDRGPTDRFIATTGRSGDVVDGLAANLAVHTRRVQDLQPDDILVVDRLPVSAPLRTIVDLGRVLDEFQLAHVIWNALYKELVTLDEIRAWLPAHAGARGNTTIRRAVEVVSLGSCGTKSRSEDEFVAIVRHTGVSMPVVNVLGSAGIPGVRLDFVWRERRVVFELDGRHHGAMPGISASDRSVFAALCAAGWITRRIHYSKVWNDPMGVAMMLDRVLGG